jgi:hypothetical protein
MMGLARTRRSSLSSRCYRMPHFELFDRTLRLRFLDIPAVGNPLELMQKTGRYSIFVSIVAYPPVGEETMRQDHERTDHERRAH